MKMFFNNDKSSRPDFSNRANSDITVRPGDDSDLDLLTNFNKQLIEDEKSNNIMNLQQLKDRMKDFIHSDYNAFIFEIYGNPAGYALVNTRKSPYYLRQFFISRNVRRMGYGKKAFHKLLNTLGTDTVELEVLYWNERGLGFWRSLGFKERSIYMRYEGSK